MTEHERGERYEAAVRRFRKHLIRIADGTFRLDIDDPKSIDVDPIVFADLKRSLEETNRKILEKQIDPDQIKF